jgi:alanine racemase
MYRNTYVEVNLDNIKSNVKNIIKNYNKYNYFIGVVKGNAYGHGYYTVKALIESGINYLAVSTLEEALQVRKWALETPILLLQPIAIEHINVCLQNNITITVCDYSYFEELLTLSLKKALKFHLKLDTGMNRLGISSEKEIKKIYDKISNNKHIILEGIYTHMGTSGLNDKNWDNQLNRFKELTKSIPLDKIPIVHIDRSLTMMMHDKISFCNGVRLGIAMFGYNQVPSIGHGLKSKLRNLKNELKRSFLSISKPVINNIALKPALSLYSEIIQIKEVDKNQYIGYGTTYKTKEDVIVATISIGYADGLILKNILRVKRVICYV